MKNHAISFFKRLHGVSKKATGRKMYLCNERSDMNEIVTL